MSGEMTPGEAAAEHGAAARELLVREVTAAGGWLSFERFMDLALYAPRSGYYSGGARKLGYAGDFTTAPEISSLFGACVGLQCAEVLRQLDAGSILEIGAGSGRMAVDILERLETLRALPQHYSILEISADLRERQQRLLEERLPHLAARIRWLDRPPEQPFDGIILANEVVDALPVTRFRWRTHGVEEMGVAVENGRFVWAFRPANAKLSEECNRLADAGGGWEDGYISEYCPRVPAWTQAVTQALRSGAALWFDYGLPRPQYYLPERHDGTLMCHHRHGAHSDPFLNVGLQDITAWVDFTLLAEASREAGFELAGFTTQAHFLAAIGIDNEMRLMAGGDEKHFARLANQARQLMMPGEMGERFKAMAWTRGLSVPLTGFALQDLRHTL